MSLRAPAKQSHLADHVFDSRLLILLSLIILFCLSHFSLVIINLTSSMPRGIYIRKFSDLKRGDIVVACLSEKWQIIALKRQYLKAGACDAGARPIIKKVLAIPGDTVELTETHLKINGETHFLPTSLHDHHGNSLLIFPRGTYKNTDGYWLIGTMDIHSWDSRYWGPIQKQQIITVLRNIF